MELKKSMICIAALAAVFSLSGCKDDTEPGEMTSGITGLYIYNAAHHTQVLYILFQNNFHFQVLRLISWATSTAKSPSCGRV